MSVEDSAAGTPRRSAAGSHARALLGALVSLVAVAGCVWWGLRQDAPRFPDSPSSLAVLAGAVALYAVVTAVRGWRWHAILRWAGIGHRPADAYALTIVGYMGNTVLPARGGEVLRILLLSERTTSRRREVLGTILPERLLDAATLVVLFGAVTLMGTAGAPAGRAPAIVALGLLLAGLLALAIYLRLRIAGRLERFAARVRPVARASRLLLTRTGLMLFGVSICIWLIEACVFWLVAQSLDLSVALTEGLLVVLLASFFALVPAAPGYVGTYDAAVLFGLSAVDVRGGAAIGFALLYRFVVFVPITLCGLVLMLVRYGGLGRLRGRTPESADRALP